GGVHHRHRPRSRARRKHGGREGETRSHIRADGERRAERGGIGGVSDVVEQREAATQSRFVVPQHIPRKTESRPEIAKRRVLIKRRRNTEFSAASYVR